MRILAHIHTFNDADVIQQALDALQRQTRQPDAIIVVDNASTDGTLDRTFAERVAVIRNPTNLGTSGAIRTGFAYALEEGFDWVWILDADSVPEPDALEHLLAFFEGLPPSERAQVCFLGCRATAPGGENKDQQVIFKESGGKPALPEADAGYSRCDCAIWSGSLYRMRAVETIGLPSADYVLDWAELEYGYRARQLGFMSYMVHSGVLHHDVGRSSGVVPQIYQFGPLKFELYDLSPTRCYYHVRNLIYFWLYQFKPRRLSRIVRNVGRSFAFATTFVMRPVSHRRQLIACLRGIRDGLTMHMERRH
jgi:GT2 family glycosyltransferase